MMLSGVPSGGGEGGLQRGVPAGGALCVQQMQVQALSDRVMIVFASHFNLAAAPTALPPASIVP